MLVSVRAKGQNASCPSIAIRFRFGIAAGYIPRRENLCRTRLCLDDGPHTSPLRAISFSSRSPIRRISQARGEIEAIKRKLGDTAHFGAGHYLHGLGMQRVGEEDLFIDNRLLAQHTLIIGTTGSGKSRLMELLIIQAIERGEPVVVIDPKGDPDRRTQRRILETALRTGRIRDVRILDLTQPSRSIRYNPLGHFVYSKQLVSRIVASMPKEGESASFRDFAYKVVNAVVNAMHALNMKITPAKVYEYSDNVAELVRKFLKARYSKWIEDVDRADIVRKLVPEYERLRDEGMIRGSADLEELNKIVKHPQEHYQKMITNLFPLFAKICTGPDRALFSNEDPDEEELAWDAVDRRRMIVYVYLGSNADTERASAIGRMTLLDLQSYLGVKYAYGDPCDQIPINIFVDELHAVLTEEYLSIINQARGAGFRVTMGSQSFADLEHVLHSRPAGKRVIANANVLIQLHVEEYEDGEVFAGRCGKRQVSIPHTSIGYEPAILKSGKHDVEDFRVTLNQGETMREVDLVPAWAVQELPVGHYFAKWGSIVYKGRFPFLPAPTVSDADLGRISCGRFEPREIDERVRVGA
jgi:conjugal transfer pilus assembly protein TraD